MIWIVSLLIICLSSAPTFAASSDAGKFCVQDKYGGESIFTMRLRPDRSLDFALSDWTGKGSNFGVKGRARPAAKGWCYEASLKSSDPAQRCAVFITRDDDSYSFSTVDGARCENLAGHSAVLYGTLHFPANSRVNAWFDSSDIGSLDCLRKGKK